MNRVFCALKAGSDRVNEMMEDIRWLVATMEGMMEKATLGRWCELRQPVEPRRVSARTQKREGHYVVVAVRCGKGKVSILRGDRELSLRDQWAADDIVSVHYGLDAVISACREFCELYNAGSLFAESIDLFTKASGEDLGPVD